MYNQLLPVAILLQDKLGEGGVFSALSCLYSI